MFFHIQNTLVSLDILEKEFCCDLPVCKGCCCIEGDAGAPLTEKEEEEIGKILPLLAGRMRKEGREIVQQKGISYFDQTGERVTQIIDGKDCVFARTDREGWCYCIIEKAFNEGLISFRKPLSCYLYPIRVTEHPTYTAVEYHRWDICHCARQAGKKQHLPLYKFLREPLIQRFGEDWYDELCLVAEEWKKQKS